jgi:hypothetical protein
VHARRYFFDARLSDPERAHEALARIRALYTVEREAKEKELAGVDLAAYRQRSASPVLAAFAAWLAEQRPRVLPKSMIGEAVTYVTNQWSTLGVYLTDGRLTIDNAAAEQAIRPLCVGRRNWLHLGGAGGLRPTAVLLSIVASVKRNGIDPWVYLRHLLTALSTRPAGADLTDLLPGGRAVPAAGCRLGHFPSRGGGATVEYLARSACHFFASPGLLSAVYNSISRSRASEMRSSPPPL